MPPLVIVVTTILCARWRAITCRAWRCVIMVSLGEKHGAGPIAGFGAEVFGGEIFGRVRIAQKHDGPLPGFQDRLGEKRTSVRRCSGAVSFVAAHADDEEERQLEVVKEIAE